MVQPAPQSYEPAPTALTYQPLLNWRPMRPNPRLWLHEFLPNTAVDRTRDRSIAQYLPSVLDQGSEGSCTANSTVSALYAAARIAGRADPVLSRMLDYYLSRVKEGSWPQDVGAGTDDAVGVVLTNMGLCAESVWPYDASPAEPPPAAVNGAQKYLAISQFQPIAANNWLDGALTALDNLQPPLYALAWYNDFFRDFQQSGVVGSMGGGLAGYHQILMTGYKAGSQLIRCRNSWGATSPARPDILSDSVAGDVFLPVSFFSNGVVQELVAVMPVGVQPQPQPQPPSPLVLTAGGPYSGAVGATLTSCGLLASVSGGTPPYSWRWLIAGYDYSHSNPLVNEATLKREGQYTCVVTCTDSANNTKDASTTFTVTAAPQPNPPPPNPPPPQGLTAVHVNATMSDGTTQRWL